MSMHVIISHSFLGGYGNPSTTNRRNIPEDSLNLGCALLIGARRLSALKSESWTLASATSHMTHGNDCSAFHYTSKVEPPSARREMTAMLSK